MVEVKLVVRSLHDWKGYVIAAGHIHPAYDVRIFLAQSLPIRREAFLLFLHDAGELLLLPAHLLRALINCIQLIGAVRKHAQGGDQRDSIDPFFHTKSL